MYKKLLVALLAVVSICVSNVFAAPTHELDGKTFQGSTVAKGEQPDPDTFIFKQGTFHSTACDKYGYTSAPYTSQTKGGEITFNATTKNDKGATIAWNGIVKGDHISGEAVMTDNAGGKNPFSFEGKIGK